MSKNEDPDKVRARQERRHKHRPSCWKYVQTCGQRPHTHTRDAGCYDKSNTLTCRRKQHAHDPMKCFKKVKNCHLAD